MVDVIVVGAHPDDIEMGFGGAVALLAAQGHNVSMLDLTDGEPTPHGDPQTRADEARQAAAILGASKRVILGLKNRELADTVQARRQIAEVYRELRPNIVFVQYPVDAHPDHIEGSAAAEKARFDAKLTKTDMKGEPWYPSKVFHYLASHLRLNIKPSFILDVSDTFEKKIESVLAYESQFKASGREDWVVERLTVNAVYYGGLIGVKYGEPVISKEEIGLSGISGLLL